MRKDCLKKQGFLNLNACIAAPIGEDPYPAAVEGAFACLLKEYGGSVRQANPAYKS